MSTSFVSQCINTAHSANLQHDFEVAVWWSRQAVGIAPDLPEAWFNLGVALGGQGHRGEAIVALEKAEALSMTSADAQNSIGLKFLELEEHRKAERCLERSISLAPHFAFPYVNLGKLRVVQKRIDDAVGHFERAIELAPDLAPAYVNLSGVLNGMRRYAEAEAACRRAIELDPRSPEAWNNFGQLLVDTKRHEAAETAAREATVLDPGSYRAWMNRGVALYGLKRFVEAAECFSKSLALKPEEDYLQGSAIHMRILCCEWETLADDVHSLAMHLERGKRVVIPFPLLALTSRLDLLQKAAEIYVADQFAEPGACLPPRASSRADGRIRVGYFSADFRNHPVSHLLVECIELSDRSRFELIGFSFGPDLQDEVRKRVSAAFDQFINCHEKSDAEVVALARQMDIDIAVDLGGHTEGARTRVFAMRAAPVQVSYLGYLGTMGAPFIDYLIADKTIIPDQHRCYYTEKIVYLPSYQANDSKRRISERTFSRKELGIPEQGFVFCCFNNSYKITPSIFDVWMRLLQKVERSVLLLYAETPKVAENLQKEARNRGVDPARLIFAGRIGFADYLAQYRVADLFLDTLPYNAGTTASDALWAGLPVLTCLGETFSGRVAASLLNAIGLPELIAESLGAYESTAIELAQNPERLAMIKARLEQNRLTTRLFDSELFTRTLEAAFTKMHERWMAQLPPDHICIE